ncbi:hypothetical protein M011DRAFT_460296 [Sporormia fimetaria CBS 119925]|uniref:LITAF domain-containing protein n=1 Tax=Sporormia fimetaria CBS 119925 TaxID=1340428 RepID=A0A6A6V4V4_9PLEO|nr:hypothetical protein M011DRAFT_460296 [Sporormia fimetaria CBS 119925]
MEKQGVPLNQYPQSPQSPDLGQQPPVYGQDPNQQAAYQQQQQQQPGQMYQQPGYGTSPPPQQHPYMTPQPTGQTAMPQQQQPHPQQAQGYQQQPQGYQQQPSQPGMPPQQQSGTQYQHATPIANLGRGPAPADCPACGQRAMTTVAYEVGNSTHAWALGICCLTCLGCIPYLMNSLKDVQHKCGRCGVLLATWHRSGTTEVHIHS